MCGRKTLTKAKREIIEEYEVEESSWINSKSYSPSYNIAPTDQVPILLYEQERFIRPMQWGLIPAWAGDSSIGSKMINARSETLQKKRTFKPLIKDQRCIIIADGYYEWQGEKGNKQPYYIYKPDKGFMSMAGLWSRWKSNQNETVYSYTVITTEPAENINHIHNRMPAILNQNNVDDWLNSESSLEIALDLLKPYAGLQYHPISKYVNSVGNNSPKCIQKMPEIFQ